MERKGEVQTSSQRNDGAIRMTNVKQAQRAREILDQLPQGVLDENFEESAFYEMYVHEDGSVGMRLTGPIGNPINLDETEMRKLANVIRRFLVIK